MRGLGVHLEAPAPSQQRICFFSLSVMVEVLHSGILAPLMRRLAAKELALLSRCCKDCRREASSPALWSVLLEQDFKITSAEGGSPFEVDHVRDSVSQAGSTSADGRTSGGDPVRSGDVPSGFAQLAQRRYMALMTACDCKLCKNRIWVSRRPCLSDPGDKKPGDREGKGLPLRRCVCVVRRLPGKVPLTVAGFRQERIVDSFTSWPGFEPARELLRTNFNASFVEIDRLTLENLRNVDIVILNMTATPDNLEAPERTALVTFIDAGGSAILNCFSQWSLSRDYGRMFALPLGVQITRNAEFGRRKIEKLAGQSLAPELLQGPFGDCVNFQNLGETDYALQHEADELRVIRLARNMSFFPALRHSPQTDASVLEWGTFFAPPGPDRDATVAGQVLLCSNFHWFCAPGYWNGGLIHEADNASLFLNFVASSCRQLHS